MKTKELQKDQRGFTLVELLVAIAIVGIITLGITMTISQIWTINVGASTHMIAVRQVQQAYKSVRNDVMQAQNVTEGANSGFPLTLEWTDLEPTTNNVITYTIIDKNTDNPKLQRSHNSEGVRVIARYIDPEQTSCVWVPPTPPSKGKLVFTVTATLGGGPQEARETRVYEIEPRPDQG